jgi:hypothetical protein
VRGVRTVKAIVVALTAVALLLAFSPALQAGGRAAPAWAKTVCPKLGVMCAMFGPVGGRMVVEGVVSDAARLTAYGFTGLAGKPHRASIVKLPDGRFEVSVRSMTDRTAKPQTRIIKIAP